MPDPLDWVELGAVGRQDDERDVFRHDEIAAPVPAGAVENQDGMRVGGRGKGEVVEEDVHRAGVDEGQDECRSPVAGRSR